jgi:hypothetical protein
MSISRLSGEGAAALILSYLPGQALPDEGNSGVRFNERIEAKGRI